MDRERFHFHVDEFYYHDGKSYFVRDSEPLLKRAAIRVFKEKAKQFSEKFGKFVVTRRPEPEFPGAIRVAKNHQVIVVLSRCDCSGN